MSVAIKIVNNGTSEFNIPVIELSSLVSAKAKRKAGKPFPKTPEIITKGICFFLIDLIDRYNIGERARKAKLILNAPSKWGGILSFP